jgi:4-hydroxy-tetrahydrodipicolinate reductase
MIKIGVLGYGKAGQAVAEVLRHDPRFEVVWVARRTSTEQPETIPGTAIPIIGLDKVVLDG